MNAQLRIVSLNVATRHGPAFLTAIETQPDIRKADILILQEVVDSPADHVTDKIASALQLHVEFASAFQLNPEYAEGLAILSRYPIIRKSVLRLPLTNLHIGTTPRIALLATLQSPSGPMLVIDTHLDDRLNGASEIRQLAPIWEAASRVAGPCIIGGDFNTSNVWWGAHIFPVPGLQHQAAIIRHEMAKREFTTPLGHGKSTYHFPGLKLDWIYLRDLQPSASGVIPIRFSDHNSVWVDASKL